MSSRREGRDSESKRSYSKIEREPSPKRSRRDGKPKTERNTSRNDLDTLHSNDQDQKSRRRLQDALPLEAPIEPETKVKLDNVKSELKKAEEENNGIKHPSDPTEVPRSRSYFQHDERERGIAGQGGRSFSRRATADRGWTDAKDRSGEKPGGDEMDGKSAHKREARTSERPRGDEMDVKNPRKRDERSHAHGDDNSVWRHDRFHDLEAEAPPPARKRPAFREKKIEQGASNTARTTEPDSGRPIRQEQPVPENVRREERAGRRPYDYERVEKTVTRDRAPLQRRESQRVGFPSRERFGSGGGGGSMGRDRLSGRYGERKENYSVGSEKWKHDLFDEANKSPSPKHAEDPIAKVEALLAS